MFTPTFRSLFMRLPSTSTSPLLLLPRTSLLSSLAPTTTTTTTHALHTSASHNSKSPGWSSGNKPPPSRGGGGGGGGRTGRKKGKKGKGEGPDPRIVNLKLSMPRHVPAPLRFARNRALRHWTIHRAWLLYQRQVREGEERELERMYNSMHTACEELRKMSGPGSRPEGYLYRVAMEKKGVYDHGGVPIEYARAQTETPAREPWNHGWTR